VPSLDLDRFVQRDSPIHALDPRVKLLATLGFILGNLLLPDGAWRGFAAAFGLIVAVGALASLGWSYAPRRSFIALPFMLAALSVVFVVPGRVVAAWQIGPFQVVVTDAGLVRLASILLRMWLSVQMAILLAATTPFPDVAHALRHLRVPAVLVAIVTLMYRFLFVLADEARRLLRARAARSAALPGRRAGGGVAWRARVAGGMAGQLMIRGLERSDRVYMAMVARGYRGQLLTMNPHSMTARDWRWSAAAVAALAGIQWLGRLG
jgi:cobalt/nickel transport system permease protein